MRLISNRFKGYKQTCDHHLSSISSQIISMPMSSKSLRDEEKKLDVLASDNHEECEGHHQMIPLHPPRTYPARKRRAPIRLENESGFAVGTNSKYKSSFTTAENMRPTGTLVRDVVLYDPKRGIFLRQLEPDQLIALSKQNKKRHFTSRKVSKKARSSSDEEFEDLSSDEGSDSSIEVGSNSLWNIHGVDKKAVQCTIGRHLPPLLRKRATVVGHFFLFCHERQCIWAKRKQGLSRPWTRDSIMKSKHFTNIYREMDAGTVFFRRHIIRQTPHFKREAEHNDEKFEVHFAAEVLWASILYRIICRVETFNELGGIPTLGEWEVFSQKLMQYRNEGNVMFTSAYQNMGYDRLIQTVESLKKNNASAIKDLAKNLIKAARVGDLKRCTNDIQRIHNVGNFLAWQVTCDLMECGVLKGIDEETSNFVKLGPGAKGGLKVIFGDKISGQEQFDLCLLLREKQDSFFDCLGVKFQRFDGRAMSLKVLEHALCEFYKYHNCLSSSKALKGARIYRGLNGDAVRLSINECSKSNSSDGSSRFCDTCWRNYDNSSASNGSTSWVCDDCFDLKR